MRKTGIAFYTLLSCLFACSATAETYSWTDDRGTVNFAEDISSVPKKYRKKVKRYEDGSVTVPPPAITSVPRPEKHQAAPVAPDGGKDGSASSQNLYAGKTYGQWRQELETREAAMNSIRNRIEEIDSVIKKSGSTRETVENRNRMVKKYNDERKQYDSLVETARNAGLKIEMRTEK